MQRERTLILADNADGISFCTQGSDVDRHICRTAGTVFLSLDFDHRHGRFRRDALHLAPEIAIEHHIAEDNGFLPANPFDNLVKCHTNSPLFFTG